MNEMENNVSKSPWPHLPKEMLSLIKNFLESPLDITSFRSVCSSWRSSTPPFKSPFTVSAVSFLEYICPQVEYYYLTQKIIFSLKPLAQSSSSTSSWLIAIEFDGSKIYFVNPFTGLRIESLHSPLPKQLNLSDFRFTELKKVYVVQQVLEFEHGIKTFINKKVLLVSPPYYDQKMLVVLDRGIIVFYELVTDQWVVVKEIVGMRFDDIILYHGTVYGISSLGKTVSFYSDLTVKEFAHHVIPQGMSCVHYLIESFGHIYLIAKYENYKKLDLLSCFDCVISTWPCRLDNGELQIKVYKLQEKENKWEEVTQLENKVFVISSSMCWSFSASPEEFLDCKGNCIVFIGGGYTIDGSSYELPSNAGVFDVETGNLEDLKERPSYGKIYWPPPNWLNPPNMS